MKKAGASVFYFGIYVLFLALLFITIPEKLLSLLNLPAMPSGWARIIGLLAAIVATCDIISGRNNLTILIRATIYIRLAFAASMVLLVLFRQLPPTTILFGVVDAIGAVWTAACLKAEQKKT